MREVAMVAKLLRTRSYGPLPYFAFGRGGGYEVWGWLGIFAEANPHELRNATALQKVPRGSIAAAGRSRREAAGQQDTRCVACHY